MIIKKFQGRTKEEALESARRELGTNIVEMNVKALKPKGIMGLFRGTRFEVTVAREEENEKYSAASAKDVQKDGVAVSFSHNEPQGKIIPMKKAEAPSPVSPWPSPPLWARISGPNSRSG